MKLSVNTYSSSRVGLAWLDYFKSDIYVKMENWIYKDYVNTGKIGINPVAPLLTDKTTNRPVSAKEYRPSQ